MPIYGQSSGDFKETAARMQLFYVVTRNTYGPLTTDAFTQANPPVVTDEVSTTLANITKKGVLGSSIAFTRPDGGNGYVGGAAKISNSYSAIVRPLGFFINDALGNAFENTPGVASNRGPYVHGSGSLVGLSLWETLKQTSAAVGGKHSAVTWHTGDLAYAGVNGLVTNDFQDSYEYQVVGAQANVTVMGVVRQAWDSSSAWLIVQMAI